MKQCKKRNLISLLMTILCTLFLSVPAFAAELAGDLTDVNSSHITGWAWNKEINEETVNVELLIYKDGDSKAAKTATVQANAYSEEVNKSIGNGYHAFDYTVNWSELGGSSYKVEAYAISGETRTLLCEAKEYKPAIGTGTAVPSASEEKGPGIQKQEAPPEPVLPAEPGYKKGESLGIFTTTGYCLCSRCSGSTGLTYSGTVPQAKHTISADLRVLPLGTKVMIADTVYTVEDKGSGVNGNKIDIFYSSHSEALNHGRSSQEVFAVIGE